MAEKYVKLSTLNDYDKWADMLEVPLDGDAKALLKYANERAVDNVVEVTRCYECKYGKPQTQASCNYVVCTADRDYPACAPTWFCPRGKPK
ncbi:hypothetical protein IKG45_02340 [Candidatus Saccharibacteria bacterium]|nr:hypothetical protein [Candidatus Saccharibacteria bacterium]